MGIRHRKKEFLLFALIKILVIQLVKPYSTSLLLDSTTELSHWFVQYNNGGSVRAIGCVVLTSMNVVEVPHHITEVKTNKKFSFA